MGDEVFLDEDGKVKVRVFVDGQAEAPTQTFALQANSIETVHLENGSVTMPKLADDVTEQFEELQQSIADTVAQFSSLDASGFDVIPQNGVPPGSIQHALETAVSQFLLLSDRMATQEARTIPKVFVSAELTGTGSNQNIAHGLGVLPSKVVVIPTFFTFLVAGNYQSTEGTHTTTNAVVNVSNGVKFKVLVVA